MKAADGRPETRSEAAGFSAWCDDLARPKLDSSGCATSEIGIF
jgi:hypothetical protein